MSIRTNIVAASGEPIEYRIERRDGCVVVYGSIPMSDFGAIASLGGPDAVLAFDLGKLLGASLASGSPQAVAALMQRIRTERLANPANFLPVAHLSTDTQRWYVAGEHGTSSVVMFCWITNVPHPYLDGEPIAECRNHPRDPGDFGRCRLLVEASPEVASAFRTVMPSVSPVWADMVSRWDELCLLMDAECPAWRTEEGLAPHTFSMMRAIREARGDD